MLQFGSHFKETENILRIAAERFQKISVDGRNAKMESENPTARAFKRGTAALLRQKLSELEKKEPTEENILEPLAEIMIRRGEIALLDAGDGREL